MSYTEGNLTETQNDLSEQNNRKKNRIEIAAGALQFFYIALL